MLTRGIWKLGVRKCRMLGFWYKLVSGNNCKISVILYKLLMKLHQHKIFSAEWIVKIENTLNECGLPDFWNDNNLVRSISYVNFKKMYKTKLRNMYTRRWQDLMESSSKCSLYRNFKTELKFEKYLIAVCDPLKSTLIRYRTSNHKLPIEVGRYVNLERKDRKCELCNVNDIGDEFHYLLVCIYFDSDRKKFCQLMKSHKKSLFIEFLKCVKPYVRNLRIVFENKLLLFAYICHY